MLLSSLEVSNYQWDEKIPQSVKNSVDVGPTVVDGLDHIIPHSRMGEVNLPQAGEKMIDEKISVEFRKDGGGILLKEDEKRIGKLVKLLKKSRLLSDNLPHVKRFENIGVVTRNWGRLSSKRDPNYKRT